MNCYIDAQCNNIKTMVKTFEQACELGALKDDGKVSKDEERTLKAIHAAAQRFCAEISKA